MTNDLPFTEFGLTSKDKDSSARLVLQGDKRATTSLLAAYAYDREQVPIVGRRSIVRDGRGREIAVIETIRFETRRFCDVDSVYAAIEGEGDKSLAHWRATHWAYLRAECARVGLPLNEEVEVGLEYFEMVQPLIALVDF
jgi:uncharacterized protein YhfF